VAELHHVPMLSDIDLEVVRVEAESDQRCNHFGTWKVKDLD
jgi:hypothetical protein